MKIPKVGNILIHSIRKKIEEKLKKLDLTPEILPAEFLKMHKNKKHRYFSPCLTKEGQKVAFYSRLHFNLDAKRKMLCEIKFLEKLKESKLRIKKVVPEIINYGIEKDFEWFEREYPAGFPLGERRALKQKLKLNLVPKMIEIIFEILKIPPYFFPKIKKFNVKNYLAKEAYKDLIENKILKKKTANLIQNFIKKNIPLLKKENKYFCHGDLNLGNLIFDGKEIYIIDWELIHLNNFAYDIGYLWAHLWQAKRSFRNALIFEFLRKLQKQKLKKFKIFFQIVASYIALGGVKFWSKNKKEMEKRKIFYSTILENCLNFEKLIKI